MAGRLPELKVQAGDAVAAGQPLFTRDDPLERAADAEARARDDSASAQAANTNTNTDKGSGLALKRYRQTVD